MSQKVTLFGRGIRHERERRDAHRGRPPEAKQASRSRLRGRLERPQKAQQTRPEYHFNLVGMTAKDFMDNPQECPYERGKVIAKEN